MAAGTYRDTSVHFLSYAAMHFADWYDAARRQVESSNQRLQEPDEDIETIVPGRIMLHPTDPERVNPNVAFALTRVVCRVRTAG
jgi:hypothetical protein